LPTQFLIKILVSALIIAGVSELGKRFTLVGAILASLPLTSILAMIWLYRDTGDSQKIMDLSRGIFWAVLPSLVFFLVLPVLLKNGMAFGVAMTLSSIIMFLAYTVYVFALGKIGISF
jgi:hypothetical protein